MSVVFYLFETTNRTPPIIETKPAKRVKGICSLNIKKPINIDKT